MAALRVGAYELDRRLALRAKEEQREVSSHFWRRYQYEHSRRAGRPTGQTDCRVQRPLHSHRDVRISRRRSLRVPADHRISGQPLCGLGWRSLGVLELTALPSIDDELWAPMVRETDALLVGGGDPLYLCYWMQQSGLADLLPSLRRTVYVGVSGGSLVLGPEV